MRDLMIAKHYVLQYLKEHPELFSDYERECILDYVYLINSDEFIPDVVREVYDEVGIIPDTKNVYLEFIKLLNNTYAVHDKNILEVGGGTIPRLAKRINHLQTTGSITVYDPRLSIYEEDTSKFHLVRKPFTESTNIGNHNLMVALMPCEACETVIRSAINNKIDFMLGFCEGGPHGDEFDYFEDDDEWLNSMLYLARDGIEENGMGKMKVKYLQECKNPYPVIYNER